MSVEIGHSLFAECRFAVQNSLLFYGVVRVFARPLTETSYFVEGIDVYNSNRNRVKGLYVSPRAVLGVMRMVLEVDTVIEMPVFDLPDDFIVRSVHFMPENGCFLFKIESSEFDPVDTGETIPIIDAPSFSFSNYKELELMFDDEKDLSNVAAILADDSSV